MAPEQASWAGGDARADIYSLGCVIYEMCTGRLPFAAGSPASLVQQKKRSTPEPMKIRAKAIDLPAALDKAVLKALAPRPADRHQTAADFRRALERVMKVPRRRLPTFRAAGYFAIAAIGLFTAVVFGTRLSTNDAGVLHAAAARPVTARSEILTAPASIETERPAETAHATPVASAVTDPAAAAASRKKGARANGKAAPAASARAPGVQAGARDFERDAELERTLGASRELAAKHPHDARVQQAWAESAAALRDWSEARKAAEAWALVDAGAEPRLFLARVLGYGGRRGAAATVLEDLLDSHPACDEARALLSDLGIRSTKVTSGARERETSVSAQDPAPTDPSREP
jgi:hypothetical protein